MKIKIFSMENKIVMDWTDYIKTIGMEEFDKASGKGFSRTTKGKQYILGGDTFNPQAILGATVGAKTSLLVTQECAIDRIFYYLSKGEKSSKLQDATELEKSLISTLKFLLVSPSLQVT